MYFVTEPEPFVDKNFHEIEIFLSRCCHQGICVNQLILRGCDLEVSLAGDALCSACGAGLWIALRGVHFVTRL